MAFYKRLKHTLPLLLLMLGFTHRATAQDTLYVDMADEMYAVNSKRLALEQYQLALMVNPNNVQANYMAGVCYYETINREKCLKYFKKAYELDPNVSDSILFQIAEGYHLSNNFTNAINYYDKFKAHIDKEVAANEITKLRYDNWVKQIEHKKNQCKVGKRLSSDPVPVTLIPVKELNTIYPDYAPTITRDEKTMVFTSRREGGVSPDVAIDLLFFEDIYISTKGSDNKWSEPQLVPGINTERHESNLGISPDGSELLIYKDDNSGDIYVSEKKNNGEWSEPEPISNTINSEFKETSASISADGERLFFASDRPGGMGGFDVYMVERIKRNKWGAPINLGPPINTEFDEDAPVLGFDNKTLFFASKGHDGMGEYDLFRSEFDSLTYEWGEPENLGYPINSSDDDRYYVQSMDGRHAYYASIKEGGEGDMDIFKIVPDSAEEAKEYLESKPKEEKEEEPEPEYVTKKPVEEDTTFEAELEEPQDTTEEQAQVIEKEIVEEEIEENVEEPEIAKMEEEEMEEEEDLDLSELEPEATAVQVIITLKDEDDNLIDADAIRMVGQDNQKTIPFERTGPGTFQAEINSEEEEKFRLKVEKQHYMFRNFDISIPEATPEEQSISRTVTLSKLEKDARPHILRNVYFDFDKASIRPESEDELKMVIQVMKSNPGIKVEIAGHTDSKGSDAYNKDLSQRRANAVVDYLVNQGGIDRSRLIAKGYGEERPLASNDDEREGRELNRRTEFKVIP